MTRSVCLYIGRTPINRVKPDSSKRNSLPGWRVMMFVGIHSGTLSILCVCVCLCVGYTEVVDRKISIVVETMAMGSKDLHRRRKKSVYFDFTTNYTHNNTDSAVGVKMTVALCTQYRCEAYGNGDGDSPSLFVWRTQKYELMN